MIIKTINVNKTMETIKEIALISLGVRKYREYDYEKEIKNIYNKRNIRVNTEI